jgi:hypothetical protein
VVEEMLRGRMGVLVRLGKVMAVVVVVLTGSVEAVVVLANLVQADLMRILVETVVMV